MGWITENNDIQLDILLRQSYHLSSFKQFSPYQILILNHRITNNYLSIQMKQNYQSQSLKSIKRPTFIKLIPQSLFLKNQFSINSPKQSNQSLPIIFSKAKTEISPLKSKRIGCFKTEPSQSSKCQKSPSQRLLSRFIYNHLQKKILFPENINRELQDSPISTKNGSAFFSTEVRLTQQMELDVNEYRGAKNMQRDYSNEKSNPKLNGSPFSINFLKNRHRINVKMKQQNKQSKLKQLYPTDPFLSKKNTSIDAYFDLSCLNQCQTSKLKHSLYN